jgi:hypothetical protein
LQVLFVLAAILAVSAALPVADMKDVVNAHISGPQYFKWDSIDQGPLETHYKSFELFVSRPRQSIQAF